VKSPNNGGIPAKMGIKAMIIPTDRQMPRPWLRHTKHSAIAGKNQTHKMQNIETKPKTVRTVNYKCAYVKVMTVLTIFPVILQTVINLIMLPIGRQGDNIMAVYKCVQFD